MFWGFLRSSNQGCLHSEHTQRTRAPALQHHPSPCPCLHLPCVSSTPRAAFSTSGSTTAVSSSVSTWSPSSCWVHCLPSRAFPSPGKRHQLGHQHIPSPGHRHLLYLGRSFTENNRDLQRSIWPNEDALFSISVFR